MLSLKTKLNCFITTGIAVSANIIYNFKIKKRVTGLLVSCFSFLIFYGSTITLPCSSKYSNGLISIVNDSGKILPNISFCNEVLVEFINEVFWKKTIIDTTYFENIRVMLFNFNIFLILAIIFIVFLLIIINAKNLINVEMIHLSCVIFYLTVMPVLGLSYFGYSLFSQFVIVNELNSYLINYLKSWCLDSGVEYGIDLFYPSSGEPPYLIFLKDWVGAPYTMYIADSTFNSTQILLLSIGTVLIGFSLFYLTGGLATSTTLAKSIVSSKLTVITKAIVVTKPVTISKATLLAKSIMAKTTVTATLLPAFTKLGVFINGNGGNSPVDGVVTVDVNTFLLANNQAFFKLIIDAANYYLL